MDYYQASWWCRCSLFQHGILIFWTKFCFNIFNASGAVKCRYRCVFYKLVPDKNSMDAISGCQALHCATLCVTLSTSDPREGGSCSEVDTCSDSGPACRDQGARRTSSGHWAASGCLGGGGRAGISQSEARSPRSLNQKRATLWCNNWGRWQSYYDD